MKVFDCYGIDESGMVIMHEKSRRGRGRKEGDDVERGYRLHQLMQPSDEEPTYRRKQVHDSRLHNRLECVNLKPNSALLLSC